MEKGAGQGKSAGDGAEQRKTAGKPECRRNSSKGRKCIISGSSAGANKCGCIIRRRTVSGARAGAGTK